MIAEGKKRDKDCRLQFFYGAMELIEGFKVWEIEMCIYMCEEVFEGLVKVNWSGGENQVNDWVNVYNEQKEKYESEIKEEINGER